MKVSFYLVPDIPGYWGQIKILKNKKDCAIGFNLKELKEYPHVWDETIKHEFAHAWIWLKYRKITHCKEWKELMVKS